MRHGSAGAQRGLCRAKALRRGLFLAVLLAAALCVAEPLAHWLPVWLLLGVWICGAYVLELLASLHRLL